MIENNEGKANWGRRILWTAASLVITALLAHAIWGFVESGRVDKRVRSLKAAGEPILPADFATPADGPDNGGTDILAAGDAVHEYAKAHKPYDEVDRALPLRPEERQVIEQALTDLAGPLAQLRQARAKPRHDWTLDLTSPVLMKIMLPSMSGQRALCNLLGAAALLDHEKGDDASALGRVQQMLFIARFTDRHPSLVGHLVSIGCDALACNPVYEIAQDLKIGTSAGEATPQQVRAMIDLLLDDRELRVGFRHSLRGERMAELDAVRSLLGGLAVQVGSRGQTTQYNWGAVYVFGPVFQRNARMMIDGTTALIPLVEEPDLPSVTAKLPPPRKRGNPMNVLADIFTPSLDRVFTTHHRLISDRRLAATTLAIRWYAIDHGGKRPAKLEELVPKYLPAVPKDSLLAGKPIGYIADGPRPRLYSAGENGVDDAGSDAYMRPYPDGRAAQRGDEWRTRDRCVYLDRQPRPAPEPSPDAADAPEPAETTQPSESEPPATTQPVSPSGPN